jgi:hypothetical protein
LSAVVSPALPAAAVNAKLIALITTAAISLGVFLSGFVLNEPAPYELYMAGLIVVWALFGLRVSKPILPLLILLVVFNIGGMISMTQMSNLMDTPLYLAVSLFLAFTAVFFAAVTEAQPQLFRLIFRAWLVCSPPRWASPAISMRFLERRPSRATIARPAPSRTRTCSGPFSSCRQSTCSTG